MAVVESETIEVIEEYDEFGFVKEDLDIISSARSSPVNRKKLFSRESKWKDLLENWHDYSVHQQDLVRRRLSKGVPPTMRAAAWRVMTDLDNYKSQQPSDYFKSLVDQPDNEHVPQIWLDIPRTFPDHISLKSQKGKDDLYYVLKAYSIHNPGVGYCQGMSYIAAVFLMFFSPEDSFWMLVIILERDLNGFYTNNMALLIENAKLFEKMLDAYLPSLAPHLSHHKIDALLFVTPWWICIYTGLPDWNYVLRIWDWFLWEGINVTYRMGLSILELCQDELITMTTAEQLLPFLIRPRLSKYGDPDVLFDIAVDLPIVQLVEEARRTPDKEPVVATPRREPATTKKRKAPITETKKSSLFGRILAIATPMRGGNVVKVPVRTSPVKIVTPANRNASTTKKIATTPPPATPKTQTITNENTNTNNNTIDAIHTSEGSPTPQPTNIRAKLQARRSVGKYQSVSARRQAVYKQAVEREQRKRTQGRTPLKPLFYSSPSKTPYEDGDTSYCESPGNNYSPSRALLTPATPTRSYNTYNNGCYNTTYAINSPLLRSAFQSPTTSNSTANNTTNNSPYDENTNSTNFNNSPRKNKGKALTQQLHSPINDDTFGTDDISTNRLVSPYRRKQHQRVAKQFSPVNPSFGDMITSPHQKRGKSHLHASSPVLAGDATASPPVSRRRLYDSPSRQILYNGYYYRGDGTPEGDNVQTPPDISLEQKQFVKEFATPTPLRSFNSRRSRFARHNMQALKFDDINEEAATNPPTPSSALHSNNGNGVDEEAPAVVEEEQMIELEDVARDKYVTTRRKRRQRYRKHDMNPINLNFEEMTM